MSGESAQQSVGPGRYCRACRHSLRGIDSVNCPECGRAFDPNDPRTTLGRPHGDAWTDAAQFARVMIAIIAAVTGIVFAMSALAYVPLFDPIMVSAPASLLAVMVLGLAAFPAIPLSRRWRIAGIALPIVCASILWLHWPLRAMLALHKPALTHLADAALLGGGNSTPFRVGAMHFRQTKVTPSNNVGFQLTGDAGGGTYLVRIAPPGASNPLSSLGPRVWYNTNWEINLGDGWWLVFED